MLRGLLKSGPMPVLLFYNIGVTTGLILGVLGAASPFATAIASAVSLIYFHKASQGEENGDGHHSPDNQILQVHNPS